MAKRPASALPVQKIGGISCRKKPGYTDIDWLRGWGERVRSLWDGDDADELADPEIGIVYNPDSESVDAMTRLGCQHKTAIDHIREGLEWARSAQAAVVPGDAATICAFSGCLDDLARRIEVAVNSIEAAGAVVPAPPEADSIGLGKAPPPIEPLTETQQRVFEIIREHGPIMGTGICNKTGIEQSTLTRHIIPPLKKRGVKNRPGAGYYIDQPT